ncbi:MAG: PhzF family phenazine biosynthesis protein [Chloroflexota bacterium]
MRYRFYTCDVFSDKRFGGNALSVLPDATGLSARQMQQIAREFNNSETTFVFPARQGYTCHVRIFTPTIEVPFAGHPNIGTAFVLASIGELGDFTDTIEITFEEEAGLVPVTIRKETDKPIWCELQAPQAISVQQQLSSELIAQALSLTTEEIITSTAPPQVASVGLPFIIVEVRDRTALERTRIDTNALYEIEAMGITPDIHVYVKSEDQFDLRTRMFAPFDNVPEDPATGSANCALVGMLTHLNSAQDGVFEWHIAQGVEMGRPSILDARTEKRNGVVTGVWIAGYSVMVSEGHIEVG